MAARKDNDDEVVPGLIDPDRIADDFVEGVASIDRIGASVFRITFYACRDLGDGDLDHIVVSRLILPREALEVIRSQIDRALAGKPFVAATAGPGVGAGHLN